MAAKKTKAKKPATTNKPKTVSIAKEKHPALHPTEVVEVASLKSHPRNYRKHPADQQAHIEASLIQHGVYRNVVIARDGTILAGHGVVEVAKKIGMKQFSVIRLNIDPDSPAALKVLAGDNEIPKGSDNDDRALAILLQDVMKQDAIGLLGTGLDEQSLAAFLLVTRPASEIENLDAASEYLGMPEYDAGEKQLKLIVTFATEEDRAKFAKISKFKGVTYKGQVWSARWPPVENEDVRSVRFKAKSK